MDWHIFLAQSQAHKRLKMAVPIGNPPSETDSTCWDSRIDFFTKPSTSFSIEKTFDTLQSPSTPVQKYDKFIEFNIPRSPFFIDLSHLMVEWELGIETGDGRPLPDITTGRAAEGANPAVPAYLGAAYEQCAASTILRDVDIRLNNVNCSPMHGMYAIQHYLCNILSYNSDTRNSRLELTGFVNERNLESTEIGGYDGHALRSEFCSGGKSLFVSTALLTPMTSQPRLLIPLIDVYVGLTINSDQFCLRSGMANPDFRMIIKKCNLNLRKIKLYDSLTNEIEKKLVNSSCNYILDVYNTKSYLIPRGSLQITVHEIFSGQFLPTFAIVGKFNL